MIIDENQLSSAHNILSTTKLKTKTTKTNPHNNRPKRLLLKASSYVSIGHSNVTSCERRDSNNHILLKANKIQHENCKEESQYTDSLSQLNHQPEKAA